jgi:hypothetical protein
MVRSALYWTGLVFAIVAGALLIASAFVPWAMTYYIQGNRVNSFYSPFSILSAPIGVAASVTFYLLPATAASVLGIAALVQLARRRAESLDVMLPVVSLVASVAGIPGMLGLVTVLFQRAFFDRIGGWTPQLGIAGALAGYGLALLASVLVLVGRGRVEARSREAGSNSGGG